MDSLTPDPDLFLDVVYLHPPLRSKSAATADHHDVGLASASYHAAARLMPGTVLTCSVDIYDQLENDIVLKLTQDLMCACYMLPAGGHARQRLPLVRLPAVHVALVVVVADPGDEDAVGVDAGHAVVVFSIFK